jgi:hypothetical protein
MDATPYHTRQVVFIDPRRNPDIIAIEIDSKGVFRNILAACIKVVSELL